MIFDECHHANNNHPYNVIMSDHYIPCAQKPKIFGMTASPIWKPRDPIMSLQTLQRNLLSVVYAVRQHAEELHEHSHKPEEVRLNDTETLNYLIAERRYAGYSTLSYLT